MQPKNASSSGDVDRTAAKSDRALCGLTTTFRSIWPAAVGGVQVIFASGCTSRCRRSTAYLSAPEKIARFRMIVGRGGCRSVLSWIKLMALSEINLRRGHDELAVEVPAAQRVATAFAEIAQAI
jgi:hypothetical protein